MLLVLALALVGAACSDSDGDAVPADDGTTSTTAAPSPDQNADEQVVFGQGEAPATVPDDFPIPEQAVIGSTMIDRNRDLTEMITTYPAEVPAVVQFFEQNLPALGYTIDSSSGTDANWEIAFSSETHTGEIVLAVGGNGLSNGTIRIIQLTG